LPGTKALWSAPRSEEIRCLGQEGAVQDMHRLMHNVFLQCCVASGFLYSHHHDGRIGGSLTARIRGCSANSAMTATTRENYFYACQWWKCRVAFGTTAPMHTGSAPTTSIDLVAHALRRATCSGRHKIQGATRRYARVRPRPNPGWHTVAETSRHEWNRPLFPRFPG
jgi:hypothetical protein